MIEELLQLTHLEGKHAFELGVKFSLIIPLMLAREESLTNRREDLQ